MAKKERWRCLECFAGSSNMPDAVVEHTKPPVNVYLVNPPVKTCPRCGSGWICTLSGLGDVDGGDKPDRISELETRMAELERKIRFVKLPWDYELVKEPGDGLTEWEKHRACEQALDEEAE